MLRESRDGVLLNRQFPLTFKVLSFCCGQRDR